MSEDDLTAAYMAGFHDGKKAAQREWVGLTREEMFECGGGMLNRDEERLCRYIEAKLKEKNT